jgi:hypothetical protein
MKPIGLTLKRSRNKYQLESRGELMLIHACEGCGTISINRIAADDDPETVLAIFQSSLDIDHHCFYLQYVMEMLNTEDTEVIYIQLYGQGAMTSLT